MQAIRRLAILVAALTMAATVAAQNAITQAGITEASAREEVLRSLTGGYVNYGIAAKAVKAVSGAARAQLVTALIAWTRAHTTSPAFLKAYAAQRAEAKPEAPTFTGTPEEEFARATTKEKADQEKSAEEMKKLMATLPPDQRKGIEEGLKGAAAAMAQMNTPEMRKMRLDGIRMQRESATTEYRESLVFVNPAYEPGLTGLNAAARVFSTFAAARPSRRRRHRRRSPASRRARRPAADAPRVRTRRRPENARTTIHHSACLPARPGADR